MADYQSKLLGRRRVFLYFAVLLFITMLLDGLGELDVSIHAVDDIGIAIVSIIGVIILAAMWKKDSTGSLRMQNNIFIGLTVIMILLQIFGILVEKASPADFGDDIPILIGLIILLLNGFL